VGSPPPVMWHSFWSSDGQQTDNRRTTERSRTFRYDRGPRSVASPKGLLMETPGYLRRSSQRMPSPRAEGLRERPNRQTLERWAAIYVVRNAFMDGTPDVGSLYGSGCVSDEVATLSSVNGPMASEGSSQRPGDRTQPHADRKDLSSYTLSRGRFESLR
jgi:hypothetical protein